jgi:hypothetical protein
LKMLADIETKALDPMRFEILRDAMTGYGLWDAIQKGKLYEFVSLMVTLKEKIEEEWRQ